MMRAPTLFFDLDGVLADFHQGYLDLFGQPHDADSEATMWANIGEHPEYFNVLPLTPNGLLIFRAAQDWARRVDAPPPVILTACPAHDFDRAVGDKRRWVARHLGEDVEVVTINGGRNKVRALRALGDVLVDDWAPNLEPWAAAGGIGIHWQADTTPTQLMAWWTQDGSLPAWEPAVVASV